ncbi:MAG TPA: hypothetical protein VM914_13665 [Pyrinomonadaceae bacterium]|jgi:hypothetical protein|nr:hypothetical protein [Pyrinomonadaceae bacterium]
MADETLLTTLGNQLKQSRTTRSQLKMRLADLEAEAERVRTELNEVDAIVSRTESALFRIVSSNYGTPTTAPASDAEIEAALRQDTANGMTRGAPQQPPQTYGPPQRIQPQQTPRDDDGTRHHHIPPIRPDIEPKSDRFFERTISYAAAVLLRESGGPLHVNEIYNRLLEGGFQFTGQNPTISIAVSLNRNNRFRKVAPGTFDLVIRDAAQQVS